LDAEAEEILLYFDIEGAGLDTQTFAHSLLSFDELYRAINNVANPDRDVEVEFVRSDQGSLRAIIRVFTRDGQSLIKAPITLLILPFLLGIIVNKITSDDINIIINEDSYVVEKGHEKIVLPKSKKPLEDLVEKDPAVRRTLRKFFSVVESDPNIKSIDFRVPREPNLPIIPIPRDQFVALRDLPEIVDDELPKSREQPYIRVPVVVVAAVLVKTKRKWEFLWSGHKISAEIRDDSFFEKLANHEYEFGQGDVLLVDLIAKQELNPSIKAYENKAFYISKVHKHTKGPRQAPLL
jgi:hypothetical protein